MMFYNYEFGDNDRETRFLKKMPQFFNLTEEEIQELDKLAEIADKTVSENTNEDFQNALTEYIRSIIQRSKE